MRTSSIISRLSVCFWIAASVAACGNTPSEPGPSVTKSSELLSAVASQDAAGAAFASYRITLADRSDGDIAGKAQGMLSVMRGTSAPLPAVSRASQPFPVAPDSVTSEAVVSIDTAGVPGTYARYLSVDDSLVVLDTAAFNEHGINPGDIAEGEARALFANVFDSLVSEGLVSSAHLDVNAATMSTMTEFVGQVGQPPTTWVAEYDYFVPATIDGIAVRNETTEFGLTVGIRRSGKLSRISINGLSLVSGEVGAVVREQAVQRVRSRAATDRAAGQVVPDSTVSSLGLRYLLPMGTKVAALAPRQIYKVTPRFTIDGSPVDGKVLLLSYAVNDAAAAGALWPKADVRPPPGSQIKK